ncbi:GNAT family N-acetyltransferase [Gorillibacterium sp. CAU 1737]|uniref:GNAT family N-acetyltransferase n=1 Tax=Gorillibacterium sp. CAU 1737 TaxID=3140362 RepID=UPI0032611E81
MIIRSFRLSDYLYVNRLLAEALTEACYEETSQALARQLSYDSELVLVAEEGQDLLGVIIGTIDDNRGYYYRLAVDPLHRRKGIGKELICTLEKRFHHRNVSDILIAVDEHGGAQELSVFDAVRTFDRFLPKGRMALSIASAN